MNKCTVSRESGNRMQATEEPTRRWSRVGMECLQGIMLMAGEIDCRYGEYNEDFVKENV
jgi:hypothetical protein